MTEEEPLAAVKPDAARATYGETLLYDYAKFTTSLSILALGGVLSLSQTGAFRDASPYALTVVVGAVALGGVSGFHVSSDIVNARYTGREPRRNLRWVIRLGTLGLGIGTGAFLSIFWVALQR